MFLQLVLIGLVAFVVALGGDRYLKNKFNIRKKSGFIYRPVTKWQTVVEIGLIIFYFIISWSYIDHIFPVLIGFFIILNSFRFFIHWKYEREKKEYILILFELGILLIFASVVYWIIY
ncbi:DUF4181 domain-containing protein [Ferdinandcohnia sp. Marseille-Q9671]